MPAAVPKISALCLVKNEERWIWFTLMAALPHVEEILIGDTGSSDATVRAIKAIDNPKIKFTDYGSSNNIQFTKYRQEQIKSAKGDWLMILDGDELWTESGWQELKLAIAHAKDSQDVVITRFYNYIGDIYHYQSDQYSGYRWGTIEGNVTMRLFRSSIPGVHCGGPYGVEGYYNGHNQDIMDIARPETAIVLNHRYMHASYLVRSNTLLGDWAIPYRRGKFLNVVGVRQFPRNQEQPASFAQKYPTWLLNPKARRGILYFAIFSPLSYLARTLYNLKQGSTALS